MRALDNCDPWFSAAMAAPAVLPRRYLWEWKDPNDVSRLWKPFSIELNEELEAGSSAGELKFEIAGSPYIAHFSRSPMIQINEATKYKREIRRREGNFGRFGPSTE